MRIILKDGDSEWTADVDVIPRAGEMAWVDRAPAGVVHIVRTVQHRFDAGHHSAIVLLDRLYDPVAT